MADFSIDIDKNKDDKSDLDKCTDKIKDISVKINNVKSEAEGMVAGSASGDIISRLGLVSDSVIERAAQMDSLAQALGYIAAQYDECESRLKAIPGEDVGYGNTAYSVSDAKGKDKRSGWRKFWDWLFGKKVNTEYTHTGDEQEKAADQEMKNAVQALIGSREKYSENYWKRSTFEERKKILNDLLKDVKKILGVDAVNGSIKWFNSPEENEKILMGYYADWNRRVLINEYIIKNWESDRSYDLLSTVVHEMRHAYQHEAIHHPDKFRVSQETIDVWKESFRTYDEYSKNYDTYREIVVEKDARNFAGQD